MFPPLLLTFAVGLLTIQLLLSERWRRLALDHPNERSLHQTPIPRTGGLALLLGTSAGLVLLPRTDVTGLWLCALGLGAISFLDDRYGLPVGFRFAAQLAAAIAAVTLMGGSQPLWWIVFALLTITWMTNLYNFMDGADGLAGGMGLLGFSAYALAATAAGANALATLCACIAAGCCTFLSRNLPPARIFMGDVGSTVLGYCAAVVGLYGTVHELWPLWFPGLVFLPFAADATVTLLRRALRREKVWQAHREHYYQRLIRSGWSHARMAALAWLLMAACGLSAVLTLRLLPAWAGWLVLAGWLLVTGLLMLLTDARWARHLAARA